MIKYKTHECGDESMSSNVDLDRFESRRSTVYSTNGVVSTSHPLAAEAGVSILQEGGNAFDAAIATAATLNVVEPPSTGIGGDAFALYRTASGDVGALHSCGTAPADATLDNVRRAVSEDTSLEDNIMPQAGPLSVTVPGAARGWEAMVEQFGALSFESVLQPAINHAIEGFPVSEIISHLWHGGEARLLNDHARESYLIDGRAPNPGEIVSLPALGETLQTVASQGADVFYEGEIAEQIVAAVQSRGGLLTAEDLATFEPEFIDPISTTYNGVEVYQLPPSTQGAIVLEALNIAEELSVDQYPIESPEYKHYLIESMKLAFRDGHRHITDPTYYDVPPLHSKEYAKERAVEIDKTANAHVEAGFPSADASDTVLITIADGDGNVVSFINSLYSAFGSGIAPDETGILLQSRGGSFSLDPDHPNRIEPGKRPFHTLIPGLLRFDENDWAAYGVMGAFMQPQGHVQVIGNVVDGGMPLQRSLDEPRWRYLEGGDVAIEARFDDRVASKLARRGHDIALYPSGPYNQAPVGGFGGAQIARNEDGVLSAATDPRKDGSALGF